MAKTKKWGDVALVCPVDNVPLFNASTISLLICPKCNMEVDSKELEKIHPENRQERLYEEANLIAQEVIAEKNEEMGIEETKFKLWGGAAGGGKAVPSLGQAMAQAWEDLVNKSPDPFAGKVLFNNLKNKK